MVLGTLTSEGEWSQRMNIAKLKILAVILTVRVWAMWNRNRRLLIILCGLALVIWIPGIIGLYSFFATVKCTPKYLTFWIAHSRRYTTHPFSVLSLAPPKPIYTGFHGCFPKAPSTRIMWWWASLCLWDSCKSSIQMIRQKLQRLNFGSHYPP